MQVFIFSIARVWDILRPSTSMFRLRRHAIGIISGLLDHQYDDQPTQ